MRKTLLLTSFLFLVCSFGCPVIAQEDSPQRLCDAWNDYQPNRVYFCYDSSNYLVYVQMYYCEGCPHFYFDNQGYLITSCPSIVTSVGGEQLESTQYPRMRRDYRTGDYRENIGYDYSGYQEDDYNYDATEGATYPDDGYRYQDQYEHEYDYRNESGYGSEDGYGYGYGVEEEYEDGYDEEQGYVENTIGKKSNRRMTVKEAKKIRASIAKIEDLPYECQKMQRFKCDFDKNVIVEFCGRNDDTAYIPLR